MTHFFFHLHECNSITRDDEGQDMPDLAAARQHAQTAARAIMCSEVTGGDLCLACHIVIEDRDSGARTNVYFRDVVTITG